MKSRQDSLVNHRFYQQPVMLTSNIYVVPRAREWNIPRVDNATPLCMPPVELMKSRQDFLINHRFYQQPVMLTSNIYVVPQAREWNIPRVDNAMNLTMSHKFCRPTMSPRQGTSIKALEQGLNVKVPPPPREKALVVVESAYQTNRYVLPASIKRSSNASGDTGYGFARSPLPVPPPKRSASQAVQPEGVSSALRPIESMLSASGRSGYGYAGPPLPVPPPKRSASQAVQPEGVSSALRPIESVLSASGRSGYGCAGPPLPVPPQKRSASQAVQPEGVSSAMRPIEPLLSASGRSGYGYAGLPLPVPSPKSSAVTEAQWCGFSLSKHAGTLRAPVEVMQSEPLGIPNDNQGLQVTVRRHTPAFKQGYLYQGARVKSKSFERRDQLLAKQGCYSGAGQDPIPPGILEPLFPGAQERGGGYVPSWI